MDVIENKCMVCYCDYIHKKRIFKSNAYPELNELEILMSCKRCRSLLKKEKKLKMLLLDVEWDLHALRYTDHYD